MEWLNNGFGLLATVFGAVGLLGGAAGYFKASRGDSIIKYQTIENDGLRRKIADVEKERDEAVADKKTAETACATKDETIAKQEEHIKYLQKLGQGSPQLKKLTTAIENQTKVIADFITKQAKEKK